MDFDDLLTDDERDDLEETARDLASGDRVSEDVLREFGHLYVEARASGLCREGALEVFRDAATAAR